MDLIDDDGNLFGVVNVVDALVVLLVLAVVAAGVALVFQPEPEPDPGPELATTDATLDLGAQPAYLADEIQVGDTYSPAENTELEVTEVYRTPQGGQTRVVLGVTLQGPVAGDTIQYGNAPPRLGRSLDIQTNTYQVSGSIRDLGPVPNSTTTDATSIAFTPRPGGRLVRFLSGDIAIKLVTNDRHPVVTLPGSEG